MIPEAAQASTLDFDCDVPPNHFSSVSSEIIGSPTISGSVQAAELRSGKNLPVAGVRLTSADGTSRLGFQLVAASRRAKKFDIALNLIRNGKLQRQIVGQVESRSVISFSFSLSPTGIVVLSIGENRYGADFQPILESRAMAFCSTGQFEFTNLAFSGNAVQADNTNE